MRKKALLAGAIFVSSILAYNCGGGGGGTTADSGTLSVYLTDAPPAGLSVLELSVYKVELCKDANCTQTEVVFSNPNGVSVDLTNLEGTLLYLETENVPAGQYSGVKITTSNRGVAVYQGVVGDVSINTPNCNSAQGTCEFTLQASIDTTAQKEVVVDFNLANFNINCNITDNQGNNVAKCEVSNVDVRVKTGKPTQKQYKYEVYGEVQDVDPQNNQFTFTWAGQTYTAQVSNTTVCEINDQYITGTDCLRNLFQGMCIELKLLVDPAQTNTVQALELEQTHGRKCGKVAQNGGEYEDEYEEIRNHYRQRRLRETTITPDPTAFDFTNGKIFINHEGQQIACDIRQDIYCEMDTETEEDEHQMGQNCITNLENMISMYQNQQQQNQQQAQPMALIEVKYRYDEQTQTCEVVKIDFEEFDEDMEHSEESESENYHNPGQEQNISS